MISLLLGLIIVCSSFLSFEEACNEIDHRALLIFSSGLLSEPTLNWSSSPTIDCCFWEGVECNNETGRVTHLLLPQRDLKGPISLSLADLTYLSHLNLSYNRLSDQFPSSLLSNNNNTGVEVIDISNNQLYGELPHSLFSQAENLVTLNISNNRFTGNIPQFHCNVSFAIMNLDFSRNEFSGHIPSGLGDCSRIKKFRAGFNHLSGSFPEDIYSTLSLEIFSLPNNGITGKIIPNTFSQLTNLVVLDLSGNPLGGSIPRDIGKLSKLEYLMLYDTNLTGFFPSSLRNCSNLRKLDLGSNHLEGELSTFNFSSFSNLRVLDLSENQFYGNFPLSLYSCTSLLEVTLARNQIHGQILSKIAQLKSLFHLSLSYNNFTNVSVTIRNLMGCERLEILVLASNFFNESIPEYDEKFLSDGFKNLKYLSFCRCQLKGRIPTWLAMLKKLVYLNLAFNQIFGSIPPWLSAFPDLFYINLSNNLISGQICKELFNLSALISKEFTKGLEGKYLEIPIFIGRNNGILLKIYQLSMIPRALYLPHNNLEGALPSEISQVKLLQFLQLYSNNLSGRIPDEIHELTDLEGLDLSNNHFSGEIPTSFKDLSFLSNFSVADNNLEGQIPSGGQLDTFPSSSFEGNPLLCGSILNRSCNDDDHPRPRLIDHVTSSKICPEYMIYGMIVGVAVGLLGGGVSGFLFPIQKLKMFSRFMKLDLKL
ncbi:hypothetical protein ACFE04_014094 [Oxalis oulophora]